jgi:deoxyribodipyrimidine photo-lyase
MIPVSQTLAYPPTRASALDRLQDFAPRSGRAYAAGRNIDPGPGRPGAVSRLSPYLRHRMVTEQEAVSCVLEVQDQQEAEKFVQEILWRTYWKGWLERRPSVWRRFLEDRDRQRDMLFNASGLRAAEAGETGIDCFDHWARELLAAGCLHNHARMWFASIWIFTLRLPWTLGADFFLRHLIDADPASNTLSWRWVAGLQTPGKVYLATPENIARCTDGRFRPQGLVTSASALTETPVETASPLAPPVAVDRSLPSILLVTPEDMHPESALAIDPRFRSIVVAADPALLWGERARAFVSAAAADAAARVERHFGCSACVVQSLDAAVLASKAFSAGACQIVTLHTPVGPVADALAIIEPELARQGIHLKQVRRDWDNAFWPHAGKGFFAFREHIPEILSRGGRA